MYIAQIVYDCFLGCHEVPNCASDTQELADTIGDCCARNSRLSFGDIDGTCLHCLSMFFYMIAFVTM